MSFLEAGSEVAITKGIGVVQLCPCHADSLFPRPAALSCHQSPERVQVWARVLLVIAGLPVWSSTVVAHRYSWFLHMVTKGVVLVSDHRDNDALSQQRRATFKTLNKQTEVRLVGALPAGDTWSVVPTSP